MLLRYINYKVKTKYRVRYGQKLIGVGEDDWKSNLVHDDRDPNSTNESDELDMINDSNYFSPEGTSTVIIY